MEKLNVNYCFTFYPDGSHAVRNSRFDLTLSKASWLKYQELNVKQMRLFTMEVGKAFLS